MAKTQLFRFPTATRRDPAVDTWIHLQAPALGLIARHWFDVLRQSGPAVRELLHDGHPTACVEEAAFAYVDSYESHLNLGFFRGAALPDPHKLLEGTGKRMRHVKLCPGIPVDAAALQGLIAAAHADMAVQVRLEAKG